MILYHYSVDSYQSGEKLIDDFTVDQVKLLEAEVDEKTVYKYDQAFFNEASDVMEESRDLEHVMKLARSYYSLKRSDN